MNSPQRAQRFQLGQTVAVVRGGSAPGQGRIYEVVLDPVDVPGWNHCSGNSAKYHIVGQGGDWIYDWQLELPEEKE